MRYIRKAEFALRDYCSVVKVGEGCRDFTRENITLHRDLKLDVPDNTVAVYIGKFVMHHDGKVVTGVRVVDDYDAAMSALRGEHIAGVSPKSVKKSLAVVLGKGE